MLKNGIQLHEKEITDSPHFAFYDDAKAVTALNPNWADYISGRSTAYIEQTS